MTNHQFKVGDDCPLCNGVLGERENDELRCSDEECWFNGVVWEEDK